jgi:hypothetical protein
VAHPIKYFLGVFPGARKVAYPAIDLEIPVRVIHRIGHHRHDNISYPFYTSDDADQFLASIIVVLWDNCIWSAMACRRGSVAKQGPPS